MQRLANSHQLPAACCVWLTILLRPFPKIALNAAPFIACALIRSFIHSFRLTSVRLPFRMLESSMQLIKIMKHAKVAAA